MPSILCSIPRDPTVCFRETAERMSDIASGYGQSFSPQPVRRPQGHGRWSLNDLSTELLTLILEQLRELDARSVAIARLVSRQFDHLAVPIAYRHLVLTDRVLSLDSERDYPRALQHIYTHTNHVTVRSDLNPGRTKAFLERIHKLSTVRWRYVDRSLRSGHYWVPWDILNPEQTRHHNTRLHVENLPLLSFDGEPYNLYLRAISVHLLVSLKMPHPTPPLVTPLNSLKQLLLAARRLETLHFEDRGQGTQFTFEDAERLPPFRELSLRSYDWRHSPEEVARHWDFSHITRLELVSVPIFNFLSSVNFLDFVGLHTLHCEDFSAHLPDLRQEATAALYLLIRNYVRALSTLSISVHTAQFPVDALLSHAHSLTSLRLRDHTGFGEEDRRCPTLYHEDVLLLSQHMRHLQTLELDMDTVYTDPPAFLRAICCFPALHTLTLHVQTVIRPYEMTFEGQGDRDYEVAMSTLQFLVSTRHAVGGPAWRSITINVGGWKRVMVRRLSEAWRSLNDRGIFAERCFVLESDPNTGQLSFREEVPVEASRASTPEQVQDLDDRR